MERGGLGTRKRGGLAKGGRGTKKKERNFRRFTGEHRPEISHLSEGVLSGARSSR